MLHNDFISNPRCDAATVPAQKADINSTGARADGNYFALRLLCCLMSLAGMLLLAAGCETEPPQFPPTTMEGFMTNQVGHVEKVTLREGDVLRITFPGAANLDTTVPIQRDGVIRLKLLNAPVTAAGKTISQLHDDLLAAYKDQIESKEINVELVSADFPVFVTGAVLRPQKVMSNHPMTVLEAIMECGGFDYTKANLRNVRVLRQSGKQLKSFTVNLKRVMLGMPEDQFYVQPEDIVWVPERFTWF